MIVFDGLHITLGDLKRRILRREKLRYCDLLITSEQTNTEYTDDGDIIPNNTMVIIRRIPCTGKCAKARRANNWPSRRSQDVSSDFKSLGRSLEELLKTENLAEANASEEDKIKAVMFQSSLFYYSEHEALKLIDFLPSNYICFRCGIPGHHIQFCPEIKGPGVAAGKRIRKSTGIPRSFLVEVDDSERKGVMLSSEGKYVIPSNNVEAYVTTKRENPPSASSSSGEEPVPDKLLCPICKDLMTDAAITPCCRNSYCDECIRTCLLKSDEHVCPTCKQSHISSDALAANTLLRQEVNHFRNGSEWSTFPYSPLNLTTPSRKYPPRGVGFE